MNPVDAAATHLTAAATTTGELQRRHFDHAWRLAEPVLRRAAHRRLTTDLVDDALQHTALKLWRSVHRGYQPKDGWAPIIHTALKLATIDIVDAHVSRDTERHELPDPDRAAHTDPLDIPLDEDVADRLDIQADAERRRTRLDRLAALAESHYAQPLWAAVIRQVAAGVSEWTEVARRLDVPPDAVRFAVFKMRESDLFDRPLKDAPRLFVVTPNPVRVEPRRPRRSRIEQVACEQLDLGLVPA